MTMVLVIGAKVIGYPTIFPCLHCPSGLPRWLSGKESAYNVRDVGSVPGLGKSPGEGNDNPLQYSCLGNPMDRGAGGYNLLGCKRVRHDLVTKQQ